MKRIHEYKKLFGIQTEIDLKEVISRPNKHPGYEAHT